MLYFFTGTDTDKLRVKFNDFAARACTKHPNSPYREYDDETFSAGDIESLLTAQGLFDTVAIIALRQCTRNPDARAFLETRAKELGQAPAVFLVFEPQNPSDGARPNLDAKLRGKLERHAKETKRADRPTQKKEEFNVFALANACAARNRKAAWVTLQEAHRAGISAEQLTAPLMWQFKTILLAKQIESGAQPKAAAKASSPGAMKKAERFSRVFSAGEAHALLTRLTHAAHSEANGGPETALALEQFVLSL